ncbi:hypothetical protein DPEC_G00313940 [Dallia pectoralis]|uniref:Uncharacterized protein n=1 Tax=Dallia pectoralis TaxID=75939 RepID=A0ACC2FBW2_DALPE|nr:hypothetical protein DPEC_G00313940 [Dallia pectoralis]
MTSLLGQMEAPVQQSVLQAPLVARGTRVTQPSLPSHRTHRPTCLDGAVAHHPLLFAPLEAPTNPTNHAPDPAPSPLSAAQPQYQNHPAGPNDHGPSAVPGRQQHRDGTVL